MDLLDTAAALALINAALQDPIHRSLFHSRIRPLMLARGDAQAFERSTVYDRRAVEQWARYMAERERRILAGKWTKNHPYSIEDMETLTTTA